MKRYKFVNKDVYNTLALNNLITNLDVLRNIDDNDEVINDYVNSIRYDVEELLEYVKYK
jgi:hypothetical protein